MDKLQILVIKSFLSLCFVHWAILASNDLIPDIRIVSNLGSKSLLGLLKRDLLSRITLTGH